MVMGFRYHYIDYNVFVNVVRFRVHKMEVILEKRAKEATDNQVVGAREARTRSITTD